MCTGSGSDPEPSSNGWSRARGVVVKTLVLIGGAILLKRLTKSTTRRDHARVVSRSLTGEKVLKFLNPQCLLTTLKRFFPDSSKLLMVLKFTREQASRDPENYFNIRFSLFNVFISKVCVVE